MSDYIVSYRSYRPYHIAHIVHIASLHERSARRLQWRRRKMREGFRKGFSEGIPEGHQASEDLSSATNIFCIRI